MSTIFLKLGGSLITDKTRAQHARTRVIARLAREIKAALDARPELRIVLGHGSGSFGHVAAHQYGTRSGVRDRSGWLGFAEVAAAAARLNQIVIEHLVAAGVPALSLPPSASAQCDRGELVTLAVTPIVAALDNGLVPVVQGDVAFDLDRGGTIVSTEDVLVYLARRVPPDMILLAGEVAGVYAQADLSGDVLATITPRTFEAARPALGGSHGTDVTGGMLDKVQQMLQWVQLQPGLRARIFSGAQPGQVRDLLLDANLPIGTVIANE